MKLVSLIAATLTLAVGLVAHASNMSRPPVPQWQTDPARCTWQWKEGGGLGLWTETCTFPTGRWEVVWSEQAAAFILQVDGQAQQVVVQSWPYSKDGGPEKLHDVLVHAGQLSKTASCKFVPAAIRPAARTMAFFTLSPTDPNAMKPTSTGEVPDPQCGSYGASTHGVRYFMTDLRWPDRAIFVDEGQERPLFDPRSLTVLP